MENINFLLPYMAGGFFILSLILGYSLFNLIKKHERAEDILLGYLSYLDKLSKVIEASSVKLKQLDRLGAFRSDDEIGFVFQQITKLQEILDEFQIKKF